MIVSPQRGYVFVHIPKTGGTSLALALEARAARDDILIGDTPKAVKRRGRWQALPGAEHLGKHARLLDLERVLGAQALDAMKVFTIVRNPWDRMVSYYTWLQGQGFKHPSVALAQSLCFSDFIRHPQIAQPWQRMDAAQYVTRGDGRIQCDLFLRLEHLAEDAARLETLIGVRLGELTMENRSERGAYAGYYSDEDRAWVERLSAADIARFGYVF
jgi:hypothetical protein